MGGCPIRHGYKGLGMGHRECDLCVHVLGGLRGRVCTHGKHWVHVDQGEVSRWVCVLTLVYVKALVGVGRSGNLHGWKAEVFGFPMIIRTFRGE